MSIDVTVRDETTAGDLLQELALQLASERLTVAELIRSRVETEARAHRLPGAPPRTRASCSPCPTSRT